MIYYLFTLNDERNQAEEQIVTKTTQADAVRFVKTRDSATSILRKLGIQAHDCNFFIEKTSDGQLAVQVAKAQMHLKQLAGNAAEAGVVRAPKVEQKPEAKIVLDLMGDGKMEVVKAEAAKTTEPKRPGRKSDPSSVSNTVRTMIREGKTNAEIWEVLKNDFALDDKKRGYPAWYRHQLRKNGEKV